MLPSLIEKRKDIKYVSIAVLLPDYNEARAFHEYNSIHSKSNSMLRKFNKLTGDENFLSLENHLCTFSLPKSMSIVLTLNIMGPIK